MTTKYTFDENVVSDLHKDTYGFRPDQSFWGFWAAANPDQKQAQWDNMINIMNRTNKNED